MRIIYAFLISHAVIAMGFLRCRPSSVKLCGSMRFSGARMTSGFTLF
jgi:hypothetical protein